ncbi:hypothetical protein [Dysosmobacter welbionis]|uniref:hypothetical protein n=1 Tax=Dysosmobacter welbionis TaxID=2093857 RepID=UPI002352F2FD|nr:hypothetical protein [Dysosmobacter welbionis]
MAPSQHDRRHAPQVTGLPVVTTVHSDYRLDYMGRPSAIDLRHHQRPALRRLDYRIGVSDAMVDLLISVASRRTGSTPSITASTLRPSHPGGPAEYLRSLGVDADENSVVVGGAARLNPSRTWPPWCGALPRPAASAPVCGC